MSLPVVLAQNVPDNTTLRNLAYICGDNVNNPSGPNGEDVCKNQPPVPPQNCTPESNPQKDPACITPTKKVDLAIKKYAKTMDAAGDSDTTPVSIAPGEAFNYYYVFENTNSTPINNVTIADTFPQHINWSTTANILVKDASGNDVTSDRTITKSMV